LNRIEYKKAGHCSGPCTLNKVKYAADRDVLKVTCFLNKGE
jgi:hypothetical protein